MKLCGTIIKWILDALIEWVYHKRNAYSISGSNKIFFQQNGCHFIGNIFKCILMNEKFCIMIPNSLKFVQKGPTNIKSAFVQAIDWHQTGNKALPEPMLTQFTEAYMWH